MTPIDTFLTVLKRSLESRVFPAPVPYYPLAVPDGEIQVPSVVWARDGGTTTQTQDGGIERPQVVLTTLAFTWDGGEELRRYLVDCLYDDGVLSAWPDPPEDILVYEIVPDGRTSSFAAVRVVDPPATEGLRHLYEEGSGEVFVTRTYLTLSAQT